MFHVISKYHLIDNIYEEYLPRIVREDIKCEILIEFCKNSDVCIFKNGINKSNFQRNFIVNFKGNSIFFISK